MHFNNFLSAYYPDTSYGGDRLYADMVGQAELADRLGYRGVTIPEHHLVNILLVPDPLQMAVKVAAHTKKIEIITSVCVLPLHDMRIFAGRAIQADILCEGRLILGVGRGAFAYEMARMGRPIEESREHFDESLDLLLKLFAEEEVGWQGKHYNFAPLTVMPRPVREIPVMLAALIPEAIEASVKRGFHIQTTPLNATLEKMQEQTSAFMRGKASLGEKGKHLRLALSRVCCVARNDADARAKLELAYDYYGRFHNIFTGPGIVEHGAIRYLPLKQTMEEFKSSIIICTAAEMVDRLKHYEQLGVDDFIMNVNIGHNAEDATECIERFAADVMPWFCGSRHRVEAAE
jgi:alkanesulfonate monooxygenase SsuD/methylene tetrahydromethanopterin reductase-like flavin-dependent oxidoreductase (luciferase family)